MGVLAPGSAHARPSTRPPIDTSRNFPAHVSTEQGYTKLFLAGNQINLTMNWLLDFMRVFLLKVMNNAFGFFLIVNYAYFSTD